MCGYNQVMSTKSCVSLPTVEHGGGSVMALGYMSAASCEELQFIDGTMKANMYCEILKHNMILSIWKLGHTKLLHFVHN